MKIIIYILIFVIVLVCSCEKVIEMDKISVDNKLVLNSIIKEDSIIKVNLSKSLHILDDADFTFFDDAKVKLYRDGNFVEKMTNTNNGNYYSSIIADNNTEYEIIAERETFETVKGKTKVPSEVEIIKVDTLSKIIDGYEYIHLDIKFHDPGNKINYYKLAVKYFYKYDSSLYNVDFIYDDGTINSVEKMMSFSYILLDDASFNGQTESIGMLINPGYMASYSDSIKLKVYLSSLSESYYLYQISLDNYEMSGYTPFAEAVQVYTNIENGLGIVTSSSTDVQDVLFVNHFDGNYYYDEIKY